MITAPQLPPEHFRAGEILCQMGERGLPSRERVFCWPSSFFGRKGVFRIREAKTVHVKRHSRHVASTQSGSFHPSRKSTFLEESWSGRFANVVLIFSQPRSRVGRDAGLRRRQNRAWRTRSAWGALAARGECAGGGGGCARTGVLGARTLEQRRCVCARAVN